MDVKVKPEGGLKFVRVMMVGWLVSVGMSVIGMLVAALIFCLAGEGQNRMRLSVYVIIVIAVILGGFYVGHQMGIRRFLWGMALGGVYCTGLFVIAAFSGGMGVSGSHFSVPFILLCLGSGMFGGMLG